MFSDLSGPHHPSRHGGYWYERRPRIALELATPCSNIASVEFHHDVQRGERPAFGGLGLHFHERDVEGGGIAITAVGALIVALTLHELRARDEHREVPLGP